MPIRPRSLLSRTPLVVVTPESSDEGSLASTFDVQQHHRETKRLVEQNLLHYSCKSHRNTRGSVRFHEDSNVSYDNIFLTKEDTQEFWYSNCDYLTFKQDYASNAKSIILVEKEQRHNPKSYHSVMERVYKACCKKNGAELDQTTLAHFDKWIYVTLTRVGLEKAVVRKIRRDRVIRRQELLHSIMEIQEDTTYTTRDRAEVIAHVAQEISHPSCQFAALWASAQTKSL